MAVEQGGTANDRTGILNVLMNISIRSSKWF
jgi:hypothetical protein